MIKICLDANTRKMYLNPVKKAYLEKIMLKFIYSFIYLFQKNSGNLLQENYQKDKFGP